MLNKSDKKISKSGSKKGKKVITKEKSEKKSVVKKGKDFEANKRKKAKNILSYKKPALKFKRVTTEKNKHSKVENKLQGIVVSNKMDKTLVISVSEIKIHPKYHKRYYRDKSYKVHDPHNKYKVGDKVTFSPSKPYSKEKRWIVIEN